MTFDWFKKPRWQKAARIAGYVAFGIVVFAGDAVPLCPLTVDYDAALMLVQTADVAMVSEPGTALGRAIEKSASLFPQNSKADRVIILVTDGEGHVHWGGAAARTMRVNFA